MTSLFSSSGKVKLTLSITSFLSYNGLYNVSSVSLCLFPVLRVVCIALPTQAILTFCPEMCSNNDCCVDGDLCHAMETQCCFLAHEATSASTGLFQCVTKTAISV